MAMADDMAVAEKKSWGAARSRNLRFPIGEGARAAPSLAGQLTIT